MSPTATRLNYGTAKLMAHCAQVARYRVSKNDPAPDVARISTTLGRITDSTPDVIGYDRASTQALLIEWPSHFVIVFRGTDELVDWLDNLDGAPVEAYGGVMRRGFVDAFRDVWEYGLENEWSRRKRERPKPTFLTGHSLGGALATVCAARLLRDQTPFMSLYTFGSPRVFKRDYARLFNAEIGARCHRFQNNTDVVSRMPARIMGYAHAGHCIYIDEDGVLQDDPGAWARFLDVVEARIELITKLQLSDIPDHGIGDYTQHIHEWRWA